MSVPAFDPNRPGYRYALIADHLAARIAAGDLKRGQRLPAERDLADEYDCALNTIRQAISELRQRGLVETFPAKGSFVSESVPPNG